MSTRTLRIEPVPASTLCRIVWNGGGEVPAVLSGHFTSPAAAKMHIDSWLASQPDRDIGETVVVQRESQGEQKRGPGRPPKPKMESI